MATIYESIAQLKKGFDGVLKISDGDVKVLDAEKLRDSLIDDLIFTVVFSPQEETGKAARWLIRRSGAALGVFSTSIQPLYEAMGRKEVSGFTVPAINIRALTYDVAQAVLRAAMKGNVGPVIFEIARSEIDYTAQRPEEYTCAVIAAAIKVGYRGHLFLQGDHFQVNAKKFASDPAKEVQKVKDLIWEAIEAGFYNIDIDTSTLVDLSKPTVAEQQKTNYSLAAELTTMIRDLEPADMTISVGGEIGEVGGKNSTVEELRVFMAGYLEDLRKNGEDMKGISKISVQSGTTHGGVPLPDGSIAKVKLDFDTLEKLSEVAKADFGLSGAVQHGASTLPNEAFDKFPTTGTAEIHLATGFQNMIYDSKHLPGTLKDQIYQYIKTELVSEKIDTDTEEQFIYKTRKKGFGPFKKELWHLPKEALRAIGDELENQFSFLFGKLNVKNTTDLVNKYIKPLDVPLAVPEALRP
ncbi:MAG: class II fructose-bisphosphate aldolase [Deltaproteobacteria bacterium]|nr:class II fructose-bisphosphate aldolase [Deltaproteobacteria bacterium]